MASVFFGNLHTALSQLYMTCIESSLRTGNDACGPSMQGCSSGPSESPAKREGELHFLTAMREVSAWVEWDLTGQNKWQLHAMPNFWFIHKVLVCRLWSSQLPNIPASSCLRVRQTDSTSASHHPSRYSLIRRWSDSADGSRTCCCMQIIKYVCVRAIAEVPEAPRRYF